jgi:tetratricopeptide (TPR) repeat protein
MGEILLRMRQPRASIEQYRRALAIDEELVRADPGNADFRRNVAISHENLGDLSSEVRDFSASESSYRAALEIRTQLLKSDPTNVEGRRDVAQSLLKLGALYSRLGRTGKADKESNLYLQTCALYRESARMWQGLDAQQALDASDRPSAEQARHAVESCGIGKQRRR